MGTLLGFPTDQEVIMAKRTDAGIAYARRIQGLRASNAATARDSRPRRQRTRATARQAAIRESS
jgi:hypothetical protein